VSPRCGYTGQRLFGALPYVTSMNLTHQSGFLLVASPALQDPNFAKSVILIVEHDAEGTVGLVLNRPLEHRLRDVIDDIDPRWADVSLHEGGPVQSNLLQLVCRGEEMAGKTVVRDVVLGTGIEDLAQGEADPASVRAFAGYSGWGSGQLEAETREGSWIVRPAEARHIFAIAPEKLWATVLRELGGAYAWMSLTDGDPQDN